MKVLFGRPLRIQVCPKKGVTPTFLFEGWDWNPKNPILGRGLDSSGEFVLLKEITNWQNTKEVDIG